MDSTSGLPFNQPAVNVETVAPCVGSIVVSSFFLYHGAVHPAYSYWYKSTFKENRSILDYLPVCCTPKESPIDQQVRCPYVASRGRLPER